MEFMTKQRTQRNSLQFVRFSYVLLSYIQLFLTWFERFVCTRLWILVKVSTIKIRAKWLHQKQLSYHIQRWINVAIMLLVFTNDGEYVCAIYFWNSCFNIISQASIRIYLTQSLIWCQLQREIFPSLLVSFNLLYLYVCMSFEKKKRRNYL